MKHATITASKPTTPNDSKDYMACKTILFNCSCHTFDQVIHQIMKSIHCSSEKAKGFAMTAHNTGRVIVYTGHKERCEAVAMTLEQIKLKTAIEE